MKYVEPAENTGNSGNGSMDSHNDQILSQAIQFEREGKFDASNDLLIQRVRSPTAKQKAILTSLKCLNYVRSGKLQKAKLVKDDLIGIEYQNLDDSAKGWCNFSLGEYYREEGRMNSALRKLEENEIINPSPYIKIRSKRTLGIVNRHLGNIENSLRLYQEALIEAKRIGDNFNAGLIYNSFGNLHWSQKNLRQALHNLQKALEIWQNKESNPLEEHLVHLNLGAIFKEYGDFNQSLRHLEIAYNYFEDHEHLLDLSFVIFELLQVGIYQNDNKVIAKYLIRLEEISYETNNEMIQLHLQISKALVYVNSDRLIDKVAAYRHLNYILESDLIYYEITLMAYYTICELLLEEYSLYKNKKVLTEFKYNLEKLERIGSKNFNQATQIDVNLLRGRLHRINRRYQEARMLFQQSLRLAKELDLRVMQVKLELEVLSMETELNELRNFLNQTESSILVDDNLSSHNEYEIPLIFFVSNQSGITLMKYEFEQFLTSNVNLISSMISAMNGFLQEAFEVKTNIKKIQHNEFHALFHFDEDLAFIYIYRNEASSTSGRFHGIIEILAEAHEGTLLQKLKSSGPHQEYLDHDLRRKIGELYQ